MTITIQQIAFGSEHYKSLLKLRYEVLRKPRGIVLSAKDTDTDDKKFHIAAFKDEKPIGCVLLTPIDSHTLWLNQMVVSQDCQGLGIGTKLITCAEKLAAAHGFKIIEMHANEQAQGFYKKLEYIAEGNTFTENTVIAIKMAKRISTVYRP